MKFTVAQSWALLDNIHINHEVWELDKGGERGVDVHYDCIKIFSKMGRLKN